MFFKSDGSMFSESELTSASPPDQDLLTACKNGNISTVRERLAARDDVPPGCNILLATAASNGHPEIVRFLLGKYDESQLEVDEEHAWHATYSGLECWRQVVERKPALFHAFFTFQGNALQQAVSRCYVDMVTYILDRGGDPGRVTDETPLWQNHFLPMETAALCATPEVANLLIRYGASLQRTAALNIAAGHSREPRLEMVKCLVQAGADINATARESDMNHGAWKWGPPLISAIKKQYIEVVRYLLESGANPSKPTDDGEDAFIVAAKVGNQEIIQLLASLATIN
ncbi:MAG: hypothetical protein Q9223_001913 [Gallowayella weberi]